MARAGDKISNPVTGEQITFLRTRDETDGELLEIEMTWTRPDFKVPAHVHPMIQETFQIQEGRLIIMEGEIEHRVGPGDAVSIEPGTPHTGWMIDGTERVIMNVTFRPPLLWEEVCERAFELANDGRMTPDGLPDPEGTMEILTNFPQEISAPPMPAQA